MKRPTRRQALAGALPGLALSGVALSGLALTATPGLAQGDETVDDPERITVSARPISAFQPSDPGRRRFGKLEFRSGLQLSGSVRAFGGFSGLWRSPDGTRLVAVSDRGSWLTARLRREGAALAGLDDAILAPMLNASGRPLGRTRSYDVEALSIEGGIAHVAIERTHEILRFDWGRRGIAARGLPVATPPEIKRLPRNRGLEGIGVAPAASPVAGAIVAIAERSGGEADPTLGFIIGGPRPGSFRYLRRDGYDVTDLAFLPDGDMLVLERWYRAWRGVGARLRRVPGRTIEPGATVEGELLLDADLAQEIDNMEALAVHREGTRTLVTLMSDDNFSMLQRTVLLEFELTG